jgi:hypothetical protein
LGAEEFELTEGPIEGEEDQIEAETQSLELEEAHFEAGEE